MAEPSTTNNIRPQNSGILKWDCNDPCASLDTVLNYVEEEARKAIDWYWFHKRWKAHLSRLIQFFAVALGAVAGLLPVLAQIFRGTRLTPENAGLFASLLVGFVAALIGLDRAFGLSSGWARYVLAGTTIHKALEEFRLDWMMLSADVCPCPNPQPDKVAKMMQRAREFATTVEGLVLQETKEWVTEFQANVSQLERDAKSQTDALRIQVEKEAQVRTAHAAPGSIEITIANGDRVDGFTFHLVLESAQEKVKEATLSNSSKWVEVGIPQGQYKLMVSSTKAGKPVSDSTIVVIKGNEVTKASLALPV